MAYKPRHLMPLFLPVLLAGLVVSCSETEALPGTDASSIDFATPALTRGVVTSADDMDAFDVWGWYEPTEGNGTATQVFDGTTVTKESSGSWKYDNPPRPWLLRNTYRFYAVYPSSGTNAGYESASYDENGNLTITNFDCTTGVDLMTAIREGCVADVMVANGIPVIFTFQHLLARVTCKVAVVNSEVTVNSLRLYGVGYQGNYSSASTPSWSVTKTCTADGTPFATAPGASFRLTPTDTSRENVLGDLLLLPQDLQNGAACFVLAYRHNGLAAGDPDRSVTVPLPAITWKAGSSYNYTLTIQAGVTLNVSVKDWDEESTSVSWGDDDTTTGS